MPDPTTLALRLAAMRESFDQMQAAFAQVSRAVEDLTEAVTAADDLDVTEAAALPAGTSEAYGRGVYLCSQHSQSAVVDSRTGRLVHLLGLSTCRDGA